MDIFASDKLSFEARILNLFCFLGIIAAAIVLAVRIVEGMPPVTILIMAAMLVFIIIALAFSVKHSTHTRRVADIVIYCLFIIVFPSIFFTNGGLSSGMPSYFTLSIFIVCLMLKGKIRVIAMILLAAVIVFCYTATIYLGWDVIPIGGLSRDQQFIDLMQSIFVSGLFMGFVVIFQNRIYLNEKNKTNAQDAELLHHEKLINLINESASLLMTAKIEEFEEVLTQSMAKMARGLEFDRVNIWRTAVHEDVPIYRLIHSWQPAELDESLSIRSQYGVDWIQRVPEWEAFFESREYISDVAAAFSDRIQAQFSDLHVKSIIAFPVYLQNNYWGFVSFDNCHSEELCSEQEAAILNSGSLLLANAIERNEDVLRLRERLVQQQLTFDISKSFISTLPVRDIIQNALALIGGFLHVSRILIAVFDADSERSRPEYFWISDEKFKPDTSKTGFSPIIRDLFPRHQENNANIPSIQCENTLLYRDGRFKVFYENAGIKALICSPIYIYGKLWGVMSIEEHLDFRHWRNSDVMIADTISSVLAIAVARDIMEKERTDALDQAVSASRAKGDFLSHMSHEMRTPLSAIIGMTAIGLSSPTTEKKDYAFNKIDNASQHLLGVVNDILDMSKIEANKLELSPVNFSFEEMIHNLVNVMSFRADERGQAIRVHIDQDIPQFLFGDNQKLAQVVTNLLSNAIKFSPDGGDIRLEATLLSEKNGVCLLQINVEDKGIGITEEQKSRLFQSFEQAETGIARKYGGTGLGLAISKRIVEMMGGEVWLESEPGIGSLFSFTASLMRGDGTAAEKTPDDTAPRRDDFSGRTVLLADDVEINREIVSSLLEYTHLNIVCVESGAEAVRAFSEAPDKFDLIFMDVQMPVMDGLDATRAIRASDLPRARTVPIVAMTANVFREDIESCLDAGMDTHLGKPINIDEVLRVLRTYIA